MSLRSVAIVAASLVVLAGCAKTAPPAADAAADETAIRAINPAWFKAYNARDADGVTALYSEDAVLNIPGVPAVRGGAAIREAYVKDIAAAAAGGLTEHQGPSGEFGVSGDLGWEWNTYTITDKSGTTVDTGKYVTVYGKKNGKWFIIRDIWNSDTPPATPGPAAAAPAAERSTK
jgi:uncharacterized protein (TIGR02246 family)